MTSQTWNNDSGLKLCPVCNRQMKASFSVCYACNMTQKAALAVQKSPPPIASLNIPEYQSLAAAVEEIQALHRLGLGPGRDTAPHRHNLCRAQSRRERLEH